jgi:acyl-CoA reductase-like NAD-dependent aldehyde dehydrogenase
MGSTQTSSGPVPLWIDGKEVTTTTTFQVTSPSTGEKLWTCSSASTTEATLAAEAAQRAFKSWRKTKPAEIQAIVLKAADIMESRREELAGYMMQETGKKIEVWKA